MNEADIIENHLHTKQNNMTSDRIPFYKPIKFSGAIHENVNSFIQKYNKASSLIFWTPKRKKSFLAKNLQNTASSFLDNYEN